jgi:hypothetical protein
VAGCAILSQGNKQVVVMMKTNDTHSVLFLAGVFLTCMCGKEAADKIGARAAGYPQEASCHPTE